ncbi:MAG: rod shape-determining protein RodA [Ruminococcaceae bacterium]|nr:rod shape-determining protein RodA [Oscillospiraceae bacterium]
MHKTVNIGKRIVYAVVNYFKNTYKSMWLVIILASIMSCMMVYSATHSNGTRTTLVQAIACLVGYAGAVIISLMDYERLGELWWLVGGGCIFLVVLTFFVGVGASGEYSLADDQAWLRIAGVSFQPSELMKIGFLITFPYHLSVVVRNKNLDSLPHLLALVGHIGFPVGLIILQGDHGTALMFLCMAMVIFIGSGISWKYLAIGFAGILAALPIVWKLMGTFQRERIRAVYNPREGDELGSLYQQTLGRLAVGSGGLTGQGWQQGRMIQSGLVPADHNDLIFTVACEEFGFVGGMVVMLLLVSIMLMSLRTAMHARDPMGRFICLGFFGLIATQTIFNIGMCLVVLPVIGITLPFFSAGGSSSMCLYLGFGLVLSVYMRQGETDMQFISRV